MYNADGLIPARLLTIFGHFCVITSLLWQNQLSTMACLPEEATEMDIQYQQIEISCWLGVALALLLFEFCTFVTGVTMFHTTTALISITCHAAGCVGLTKLALDSVQDGGCGWLGVIVCVTSILPFLADAAAAATRLCAGLW